MDLDEFIREFGVKLPEGEVIEEGRRLFLYTGKKLPLDKVSYGMRLATVDENDFRPTIELCQLATRGFVELDEKDALSWMCGLDLKKDLEGDYVILKYRDYILGAGKPRSGRIINSTPKNRRLPLKYSV